MGIFNHVSHGLISRVSAVRLSSQQGPSDYYYPGNPFPPLIPQGFGISNARDFEKL